MVVVFVHVVVANAGDYVVVDHHDIIVVVIVVVVIIIVVVVVVVAAVVVVDYGDYVVLLLFDDDDDVLGVVCYIYLKNSSALTNLLVACRGTVFRQQNESM